MAREGGRGRAEILEKTACSTARTRCLWGRGRCGSLRRHLPELGADLVAALASLQYDDGALAISRQDVAEAYRRGDAYLYGHDLAHGEPSSASKSSKLLSEGTDGFSRARGSRGENRKQL